jgi:hypothetical protein
LCEAHIYGIPKRLLPLAINYGTEFLLYKKGGRKTHGLVTLPPAYGKKSQKLGQSSPCNGISDQRFENIPYHDLLPSDNSLLLFLSMPNCSIKVVFIVLSSFG